MNRAILFEQQLNQISTVRELTDAFENIASMRITKIKDRVTSSKEFFAELWNIYTQLRVNPNERLVSDRHKHNGLNALIVITSEGGLSGDIDERIIERVLQDYDQETSDIIIIGSHGLTLLALKGVKVLQFMKMPESAEELNVSSVTEVINTYRATTAYYQTYESLAVQEISKIDLFSAVKSLAVDTHDAGDVITSLDYVFEPGIQEIADHFESIMVGVALGQIILESKLAQFASRFNAMNSARKRAEEMEGTYKLRYHRVKRAEEDERLKEVIVGLKHR